MYAALLADASFRDRLFAMHDETTKLKAALVEEQQKTADAEKDLADMREWGTRVQKELLEWGTQVQKVAQDEKAQLLEWGTECKKMADEAREILAAETLLMQELGATNDQLYTAQNELAATNARLEARLKATKQPSKTTKKVLAEQLESSRTSITILNGQLTAALEALKHATTSQEELKRQVSMREAELKETKAQHDKLQAEHVAYATCFSAPLGIEVEPNVSTSLAYVHAFSSPVVSPGMSPLSLNS